MLLMRLKLPSLLVLSLLLSMSLKAQSEQSEPVLHLAFENSVVDSTGLNPDITVEGGQFVEDRNGNPNSAFYFDGVDDAITITDTDNTLDGITELSFMGWVKYEGFDSESYYATLLERFDSYETEGYFFGLNRDGNLEVRGYTSEAGLESNEWVHIAFTVGDGVMKFYMNGEKTDEINYGAEGYVADNSDITLGLSEFSNSPFQGSLDEIKIYDYAVTDNLVRSEAGLEPIPDYSNSKILDMSFNENLIDSSIGSHQVIASSGAYTEGRFGNSDYAFSFLEDDAYLSLDYDEDESALSAIDDLTVMAWIKVKSFNTTESIIIQKPTITQQVGYQTETVSKGFRYYINSSGLLELDVDGDISWTLGLSRVLPQEEWVHVATTFEDGEFKHYFNGELIENRTVGNRDSQFQNSDKIFIGNNESLSKPFNGDIDQLKVFNYVLSKSEISQHIDYVHVEPIPAPKLLLYLPFNEESNEEILPGYYEENDIVNGKDRFQEENKAIDLESNSSKVVIKNIPSSFDSLSRNISLSAWVRIEEDRNRATVISRSDSTGGDGFRLSLEDHGQSLNLSLNGISVKQNDFAIERGNWVHVGGTYNGEIARLYVNGRLIKEDSVRTKLSVKDPNLYIGQNVERRRDGDINRDTFIGKIDEVRLHNYALNPDSIATYYEDRFRGYETEPRSVLSLNFAGSITDSSTVNNTIETIGTTFVKDRFGESESAISFDGVDDKVTVKDTDNAIDSISTGLTISTWVKMEREYSGSYPGETLVQRNDGQGYQYGLEIREDYNSPGFHQSNVETVVFKIGGAELTFRDSPVQPGEWFHIAGTFDGQEMKLYLNGREAKTQPFETIINMADADLFIGNNTDENQPFRGRLDEFQMYNYSLSDSVIAELYSDRPQSATVKSPKQVLQLSFENSFEDSSRFRNAVLNDGGKFEKDRFQFEKSAYSLDGIDDVLIVSDTSSAIDSLGDGFTVSGWYFRYPDEESQAEFNTTAVMSAETIDQKNLFGILFRKEFDESDSRRLIFNVGEDEISYTGQATTGNRYWYHIAGTYDGSEMKLYVNGEMVDSKSITDSELLNEPVSKIFIGNNQSGKAPIYGILDEIKMYTYALSQAEVASMIDIEITLVGNEPEPKPEIPSDFELSQNYPNPFNPTTNIQFNLPKAGKVVLKVFNTLGREVAILKNGIISSGAHSVTFDAASLSSGVYFYQLRYNEQVVTKKMLLIK